MPGTKTSKAAVRKAAETELERAVAKWIIRRSDDYEGDTAGPLRDLLYGGCASGIVGDLIYYTDTVRFYEKHKEDIWTLAIEQAEDQGESNVFAMMAQCRGAKDGIGDYDQMANFLAWFSFEEAARTIADRLDLDL